MNNTVSVVSEHASHRGVQGFYAHPSRHLATLAPEHPRMGEVPFDSVSRVFLDANRGSGTGQGDVASRDLPRSALKVGCIINGIF